MKTISKSFFNGLKRSDCRLTKCWRIERSDGPVLCFTEHDNAIFVAYKAGATMETYLPTNSFSSTAFDSKNDMSVDNLNVTALSSDLITENDLHAGRYDDADVRVFYVQWDHPEWGVMPLLRCTLGEITFNDGTFETELRSKLQTLQQSHGRIYDLVCDASLGDFRCKKDVTAFTVTGTVTAIYDALSFIDSNRTEEDDWFQYGDITFLTGQNAGLTMEVRGYKLSSGVISLLETPAYPVDPGDTYSMVAGCDKGKDTCKIKFGNYINYRGFADIPTEQKATQTPNADNSQS